MHYFLFFRCYGRYLLRAKFYRQKEHKPVPELVEILNCRGGCNFGTGTDHCTALDDVDYKINARKRDKIAEQVLEHASEISKLEVVVKDGKLDINVSLKDKETDSNEE